MKKQLVLLALVFLVSMGGIAQNKSFTLDEVIPGGKNYRNFIPENLSQLQWAGFGNVYTYVENDALIAVNARNGKANSIIHLDELNVLCESTLTSFPRHEWTNEQLLCLHLKGKKVFIDTKKKSIARSILFPSEAADIDLADNGKYLAYTLENNLYIATPGLARVAVTNDVDRDIVNGQTYHRNEFGISKGTFWSPAANYLAFARKDERKVGAYPLVNIESREATVENIKYPMAGMESEEVTIGVYSPSKGSVVYLQTGQPADQYLTNLAWSPDEGTIYLAVLNREQNHMQLNAYDAETGKFIATLFDEKSTKYVEPLHPPVFVPGQADRFVWQSQRDGHLHLYLYNTQGALLKQLTSGAWDVSDFQGFTSDGNFLFYTSTEKSPIERHSYRLNLNTGEKLCLTPAEGTHSTLPSHDGSYLIDQYSSLEVPRKIELLTINGMKSRNLLTAANPYSDYALGETSIFTIKAADDSTDLYCRMITPPAFDASKQYPVVVYVYGGPHAQLVHKQWMGGARMWQHYMAQKGYITFTVDNRGSAGRGRDFEQIIHRNLGKAEMADQMRGIDYLKSLPYVDENRIGLHGWSYGGFMCISLMTHHPGTFKAGVAGGPVIDWKYYEIMYGERYMDTPQENPEGYENSNLANKANRLQDRLLIIHGAIDPVVVWQHSLQFLRQSVKAGTQPDYFVYPRHEHNVRGSDRVHLMDKVSRYFDDFL